MPSCKLIERKMRLLISKRETDDDVLAADLPQSPSDDHFCGIGPRRPSIQTKYHSVMAQLVVPGSEKNLPLRPGNRYCPASKT